MTDIETLLERGVDEVIDRQHLAQALKKKRKLRIKFGIDPTAPDLHLGHTVPLRKLRQFQELGHQVILLIGDYTALVGDPSGKSETRPMLTANQIKQNMQTYTKQAGKVLDLSKVELRYNSEWFASKGSNFLLELASKFTVTRILERDDFQKRLKNKQDISLLETLYPILQGYDSVALQADVELGGTDQKFNLLMGRKMQKRYSQPEQDVMTVPLIEGLDGVQKMSKSANNYIGLTDNHSEMFGKIMSVPDNLLWKYFLLMTDVPTEEIEQMKQATEAGKMNPRDAKIRLGHELVALYHGAAAAEQASSEFKRVFSEKKLPDDIPTTKSPATTEPLTILVELGLAGSKSIAKRLYQQGGVKVNKTTLTDWQTPLRLNSGDLLQVGRRQFVKIL